MSSLKRKKNSLALKSAPGLALGTSFSEQERDMFLDNLTRLLSGYGFQQVFLPPLEERNVFFGRPQLRKHFASKLLEINAPGDLDLALNPTYLLSVFKKYLQNWQNLGPHVAKWFYLAAVMDFPELKPVIRHELGIFILGEESSLANVQLINTVMQVLGELGVAEAIAEINSLGCGDCQKDYQNFLREHLHEGNSNLCLDCLSNLEENFFALGDCGQTDCQSLLSSAPPLIDFLDERCRSVLTGVLEAADELGIPYSLNPGLLGTFPSEQILFQVLAGTAPRQKFLGQGGNFTSWGAHLGRDGDKAAPLLGFTAPLEELYELVPQDRRRVMGKAEVFIIPLGEIAARRVLVLQRQLQHSGIRVSEAILQSGGIKIQLKEALERNSDIALIIGQKEALDETVILRDIRSGMQEVFASERIIEEVKKRLGK